MSTINPKGAPTCASLKTLTKRFCDFLRGIRKYHEESKIDLEKNINVYKYYS